MRPESRSLTRGVSPTKTTDHGASSPLAMTSGSSWPGELELCAESVPSAAASDAEAAGASRPLESSAPEPEEQAVAKPAGASAAPEGSRPGRARDGRPQISPGSADS